MRMRVTEGGGGVVTFRYSNIKSVAEVPISGGNPASVIVELGGMIGNSKLML